MGPREFDVFEGDEDPWLYDSDTACVVDVEVDEEECVPPRTHPLLDLNFGQSAQDSETSGLVQSREQPVLAEEQETEQDIIHSRASQQPMLAGSNQGSSSPERSIGLTLAENTAAEPKSLVEQHAEKRSLGEASQSYRVEKWVEDIIISEVKGENRPLSRSLNRDFRSAITNRVNLAFDKKGSSALAQVCETALSHLKSLQSAKVKANPALEFYLAVSERKSHKNFSNTFKKSVLDRVLPWINYHIDAKDSICTRAFFRMLLGIWWNTGLESEDRESIKNALVDQFPMLEFPSRLSPPRSDALIRMKTPKKVVFVAPNKPVSNTTTREEAVPLIPVSSTSKKSVPVTPNTPPLNPEIPEVPSSRPISSNSDVLTIVKIPKKIVTPSTSASDAKTREESQSLVPTSDAPEVFKIPKKPVLNQPSQPLTQEESYSSFFAKNTDPEQDPRKRLKPVPGRSSKQYQKKFRKPLSPESSARRPEEHRLIPLPAQSFSRSQSSVLSSRPQPEMKFQTQVETTRKTISSQSSSDSASQPTPPLERIQSSKDQERAIHAVDFTYPKRARSKSSSLEQHHHGVKEPKNFWDWFLTLADAQEHHQRILDDTRKRTALVLEACQTADDWNLLLDGFSAKRPSIFRFDL
jgi:hypothetical protein